MNIKELLVNYGHHFCDECYDLGGISGDAFKQEPMTSKYVMAAIRSYQTWFKDDLDRFTMRSINLGGLQRRSIADGIALENTNLLFTLPRCGVPDYLERGTERVSIPRECRNHITTSYNMRLSGVTPDELEELWQLADKNWSDALDVDFVFRKEDFPNTMIHTVKANLPNSVLADQFLWWGDCSADSAGRVDSRNWDYDTLMTVITHEHGHAMGAVHSPHNTATMYPSITNTSIARKGAPNKYDLKIMVDDLGYKLRDTPPTPDWISGDLEVKINTVSGEVIGTAKVLPTSQLTIADGKLVIDGDIIVTEGDKESRFHVAPNVSF